METHADNKQMTYVLFAFAAFYACVHVLPFLLLK